MRIAATFPFLVLTAALWAQSPSAPVPAAQPEHKFPLHERASWANSQAPQVPLTATQWRTEEGYTWVFKPEVSSCPLVMQIRQGLGSRTLMVNQDGSKSDMFAARLHMTLLDPRPQKSAQKMVEATVTVSGLNGRDHVMGLDEDRNRAFRITRTLTVPLDYREPEANAELRLPGFTATSWVQLKSVTYDDGDVWTFSSPAACGVRPDPLMLIAPR